ncbi:MEKHLA domain-containing protein [Paenibacillus senegalensis]|uniref:MEKHLA domain-containing protein n=1 Tax=Paenibacillus senegalensis TaxID=1465766 RepID=UPI00028A1664|nr:MEKHLA domain-containing protein [Paenibacillus senegalensis]
MKNALQGSGSSSLERHARLLLKSYKHWTGLDLIPLEPERSALHQLEEAPLAVLSHGTEEDPVLNYGNRMARQLWEMEWEQFTAMPSRLTAEPLERKERERFFELVTKNGWVGDYTGVRISSTGKRFSILKATVWNLLDEEGNYYGQAAAFSDYRYL